MMTTPFLGGQPLGLPLVGTKGKAAKKHSVCWYKRRYRCWHMPCSAGATHRCCIGSAHDQQITDHAALQIIRSDHQSSLAEIAQQCGARPAFGASACLLVGANENNHTRHQRLHPTHTHAHKTRSKARAARQGSQPPRASAAVTMRPGPIFRFRCRPRALHRPRCPSAPHPRKRAERALRWCPRGGHACR